MKESLNIGKEFRSAVYWEMSNTRSNSRSFTFKYFADLYGLNRAQLLKLFRGKNSKKIKMQHFEVEYTPGSEFCIRVFKV